MLANPLLSSPSLVRVRDAECENGIMMMEEEEEKGRRDFVGRDDALPSSSLFPLSGNRLRDSLPERRASGSSPSSTRPLVRPTHVSCYGLIAAR